MTVNPSKHEDLPLINSLRSIASLSVYIFHIVCTTINFIHLQWVLSLFSFGRYGVQVFFVISRSVIPYSLIKSGYGYKHIGKFLLKRFIRLEPPYIAGITIALAYVFLRNFIPGTSSTDLTPSTRDVVLHLGYMIPFFDNAKWLNDVFWTLAVEFQYYIILTFIILLLIHRNPAIRYIIYTSLFTASYLVPNYRFFIYWAPLFVSGISYCLYLTKKIVLSKFLILVIASATYTFFAINVTSFILVLLTLGIIVYLPNIKSGLLQYLGNISYSLYLIHCLSGLLFVNLASHYVSQPYQKFIVVLGGIGISILFAHILYVLVEKPSKKWASKIKL